MKQVVTQYFANFRLASTSSSGVMPCHLIGSLAAACLLGTITWTGSQNGQAPAHYEHNGVLIDLSDATALIENAEQWRKLYTINYRHSQRVNERIATIGDWLPSTVDWHATQQDLRQIGEAYELRILQLSRGEQHVGARTGVVTASCVAQGTFASLSRFLQHLSQRPHPIACNEIDLHRAEPSASLPFDSPSPLCHVTLSLRIPFAAPGTAASQLMNLEVGDAI